MQQRLNALIAAISTAAPGTSVSISYGILKFSRGERYLYAGAWKQHIGVYPVYPNAGALEPLVAPYRAEKDTLKFPHKAELPLDLVEKLATARL